MWEYFKNENHAKMKNIQNLHEENFRTKCIGSNYQHMMHLASSNNQLYAKAENPLKHTLSPKPIEIK